MLTLRRAPSFVGLLTLPLTGLLFSACDCGTPVRPERDVGPLPDVSDAPMVDGGPGDAPRDVPRPPDPDGGTAGLVCEACTTDEDCGAGAYCVELTSGGSVCLQTCIRDLAECPSNFDCIDSVITPRPDPVCTPVGERCCVDGDGDDYGVGVGCDGPDCDDADGDAYPGAPELCNGLDDDCDGATDEEVTGTGVVCSTGMSGACSRGTTQCVSNSLVCVPEMSTMGESCNGIDDDCDSNVDEDESGTGRALTRGCYDGPTGTDGVGRCLAGVQTCAGGMFTSCIGQVLPGTETCNAEDDDCDGAADDGNPGGGFACSTGLGGECGPGTVQCNDGALSCVGTVLPDTQPEVCDAIDNDCDGAINEDFPGLGTACFSGLGTCRRAGVTVCDPSDPSGAPICDGVAGTPSPSESCDYVDDDCDGVTDEGFRSGSGVYGTTEHCGACGFDCELGWPGGSAAYHVVPRCNVAGSTATCGFTCETGWIDADGVRDNGCELFPEPDTIYVSTPADGGADTSTCGAWDAPCATIGGGLLRAQTSGRVRVRVSSGLFVENVTLVNGISLLGGHNATNWVRNPNVFGTSIRGTDVASSVGSAADRITVVANSITSATELSGFVITSVSAGTGGNSIAVWVRDSDNDLLIQNNTIIAGTGGDGATGSAGASGAAGGAGATGFASARRACGSAATAGPAGAVASCGGVSASGGAGGSATNPVTSVAAPTRSGSGAAGLTAPRGGAGGAGGFHLEGTTNASGSQCSVYSSPFEGAPGVSGLSGVDGAGGAGAASATGSVSGGQWRGQSGGSGSAGQTGGGGGGGGAPAGVDADGSAYCLYSATGGSGGAGGCGGGSGVGGTAGGGSFGVFLVFSASPTAATLPRLTGNSIRRGLGGRGGDGGTGGGGGEGGLGGAGGPRLGSTTSTDIYAFCMIEGAPGGSGGRGGHAGGGGGGAGGVSFDIWISRPGSASPTYGTTNTFEVPAGSNTGGSGGSGGNSSNTSIGLGAAGTAGGFGTVRIGT